MRTCSRPPFSLLTLPPTSSRTGLPMLAEEDKSQARRINSRSTRLRSRSRWSPRSRPDGEILVGKCVLGPSIFLREEEWDSAVPMPQSPDLKGHKKKAGKKKAVRRGENDWSHGTPMGPSTKASLACLHLGRSLGAEKRKGDEEKVFFPLSFSPISFPFFTLALLAHFSPLSPPLILLFAFVKRGNSKHSRLHLSFGVHGFFSYRRNIFVPFQYDPVQVHGALQEERRHHRDTGKRFFFKKNTSVSLTLKSK